MNSGSSTLKYQLFQVDGNQYDVLAKVMLNVSVVRLLLSALKFANGEKKEVVVDLPNHNKALDEVLKLLLGGAISSLNEIYAVGHRVVQGGSIFKKSISD